MKNKICENCKHWDTEHNINKNYGYCEKIHYGMFHQEGDEYETEEGNYMHLFNDCDDCPGPLFPKNFRCIHWKATSKTESKNSVANLDLILTKLKEVSK